MSFSIFIVLSTPSSAIIDFLMSQSQFSFTDSDLIDLNSDRIYPDNFSDFISIQTPVTSISPTRPTIAPSSLSRVGPPLQKNWILYPYDSTCDDMEDSRKKFVSWWLTTEYGSQPDVKNTIRWESKNRSDIWDSFSQVANEKNGKPKVMCKSCLCTIGHPRYRRSGSSPMTAHLKTGSCSKRAGPRIDQIIKQMVC